MDGTAEGRRRSQSPESGTDGQRSTGAATGETAADIPALRRALRVALRLMPASTRVPVLAGPLRGRSWIVGSSLHGSWLGTFERQKQVLFSASLRQGDVVYDVGAHVGLYTLIAASRIGPVGHVYAFEPLPRNVSYLRRHLSLNSVTNCSIVEAAVTSTSGAELFDEDDHPAMGHLGAQGIHTLEVTTATLDELVAQSVIQPPAVIKCDIEGAEFDALTGGATVLSRHRPIIFLATHGSEVHARCCELLDQLDFDLYSLGGEAVSEATEIVALPR